MAALIQQLQNPSLFPEPLNPAAAPQAAHVFDRITKLGAVFSDSDKLQHGRGRTIAPNANLAFTLARASNVIGGLHSHERVHPGAERFLNSEGHLSGQVRS